MEALDGVSAAFVNNGITLLLDHEDPLDEAAVQAALDPLKIRVSKVEKAEQLPF